MQMRSLYKVFDNYIGDGKNGKVKKMYFFLLTCPFNKDISSSVLRDKPRGRMAEWLCRGLQILRYRFDSGFGLQDYSAIAQR